MAVIHVSEDEAVRELPELLLKVRAGNELMIGSGASAVTMRSASDRPQKPILISEAVARLKQRGSSARLDGSFEADLNAVIREHETEVLIDPWESS